MSESMQGAALRPCPAPPTLASLGAERLATLCEAIGMGGRAAAVIDLFHRMIAAWGSHPVERTPRWPSQVGDDHTPFEFSIAFGKTPELRIMVEPIGATPSLRSNRDAAIALMESLAQTFDVDTTRFQRVRDLFVPDDQEGAFAIWIAAGFRADKPPEFKIYLNPESRGRARAPAVIEEALGRLGFHAAWSSVAQVLTRRGPELDELKYFSLDLGRSSQARTKVYARHQMALPTDLERAASAGPAYRAGDIARFLEMIAPDATGSFTGRPPFTCYAFVRPEDERPSSVTTHFPVNGYAPHDEAITQRVTAALSWLGLPTDSYARALAAFANRPLASGIGLQSYASYKSDAADPRLTVYLPVEVYSPGTVARPELPDAPVNLGQVAGRLQWWARSFVHHPYLRRLKREGRAGRSIDVAAPTVPNLWRSADAVLNAGWAFLNELDARSFVRRARAGRL